jgi:hypothetical protein
VLARHIASGHVPADATVLVALGTNNYAASPDEAAGWLRSARGLVGDRRLLWVGLHLDERKAPRLAPWRAVERALREAALRNGVEFVDWDGWVSAHGVETRSDGIHYDAAGYESRAACYATALAA